MRLVWSCPTCFEDLEDNYLDLYCPKCERTISWLEFAELDTDDERNEFLTAVPFDG